MHVLFVHQNFPAQFGPIGRTLRRQQGYRCTFVTNHPPRETDPDFEVVPYGVIGGATRNTHYFARTFENSVAHAHGVFQACRSQPDLRPDLIVAHSGFGSSLLLRELYDCPIINYFEYYYHPHDSDLDFRPDVPAQERDVLRSYCRNAMLLLDLENCDAGYSPTVWQRSRFPARYADKIDVIFDGVDTQLWQPRPQLRQPGVERRIGDRSIADDVRIVTYVSRGFESMRGFDIFMQAAKRINQQHPRVLFVVVGSDRIAYGGDRQRIREKSFREHVLAGDEYDLSKFFFTGVLPPAELAQVLAMSDVHLYLTVPFVLSWSLFNALACGAVVVASDTAPVRELIEHGRHGLLADFFDAEGLANLALEVLRHPDDYRQLGANAKTMIDERYALPVTLPRMLDFYSRIASRG